MFSKYFVGRDMISSADKGKYKPISRITFLLDDNNSITAGDDTGLELTASCPHATQSMADALFQSLKGYRYQAFEVTDANLNPAAELGDGVTANGLYGVLSRLSDDGSGYPSFSAPGEVELEDEYPTAGPMEQKFNRQLAQTRSLITKTSEQIRLEVMNEVNQLSSSVNIELGQIRTEVNDKVNNLSSSVSVELGQIRTEVRGKIDGSDAQSLINAAIGEISLEVSSANGSTTFKLKDGSATLSTKTLSLSVDAVNISGKLTADQINATGLTVNAANIIGTLTVGQLPSNLATTSDVVNTATVITNSAISTASITANQITSGTFSGGSLSLNGLLTLLYGYSVYGYVGATTTGVTPGAVLTDYSMTNYFIATGSGARMSAGNNAEIWVQGSNCFATSTFQISSDQTVKHDISYNLSREELLFSSLRPCSFAYNWDTAEQIHWGFIAQEFAESAQRAGFGEEQLAVLAKYDDKYSIGYGEITALNTHMIQQLMKRITALEEAINGTDETVYCPCRTGLEGA